jgi:hypothetical protein
MPVGRVLADADADGDAINVGDQCCRAGLTA